MSGTKQAIRLAALRAAGALLARREARRPTAIAPGSATARPRILLIRPDHLGDVLLATPAAQVLREAVRDAEITWLVGPWAQEIAARAGGPAEVLTLDFPGFTRRPKASLIEPYWLLCQEATRLRARHFDVALILRPDHWWGALLAAAAGIPRRFGYAVPECHPFLTDLLPPPTGHVVQASVALSRLAATALGGRPRPDMVSPRFPLADGDGRNVGRDRDVARDDRIRRDDDVGQDDDVSREHDIGRDDGIGRGKPRPYTGDVGAGLAPPADAAASPVSPLSVPERGAGGVGSVARLIVVHPGSGAAVKNWRPDRWAAVIGALRQEHHAEIVLTGGPAERDLVQQIAARLDPPPLTLAGETTLDQLAALFARCDLVLGCDSGPLHLAAAVGTPTVRLYGPTDIAEFGPWPPDGPHVVLAAGLPCQPCRNLIAPPCGAVTLPACLRAITPEQVVAAASQLLQVPDHASDGSDAPSRPDCHPERSEGSHSGARL